MVYTSRITLSLVLLALFATSGCSTVMEGRSEKITVTSSPAGADCVFKQADDVVGRVTTPGSAIVYKTKNDLVILCSKPGYESVSVNNHSDMSLASLGNMILGNYSFIGNAVDSASGATNKYDAKVAITLVPALAPAAFPAPPGAPPTIKLAEAVAAGMSMQVPMPEAALAPAPKAIASVISPQVQAAAAAPAQASSILPQPSPSASGSGPQITKEPRAIAAPVISVASGPFSVPAPYAPVIPVGNMPSLNASFALGNAAAATPSPAQLALRNYAQAVAESPRRPPFDVEE